MNIYKKIQNAKVMFLEKSYNGEIKKSGNNRYANFRYFELSDITPTFIKIMTELKLFSQFSFDNDFAYLRILDTESKKDDKFDEVMYTLPMSTAAISKNEVQNMGAVQTYSRRYLMLSCLEITEPDILDSTIGKDKTDGNREINLKSKPTVTAEKKKNIIPKSNLKDECIKLAKALKQKQETEAWIENVSGGKITPTADVKKQLINKVIDERANAKEYKTLLRILAKTKDVDIVDIVANKSYEQLLEVIDIKDIRDAIDKVYSKKESKISDDMKIDKVGKQKMNDKDGLVKLLNRYMSI